MSFPDPVKVAANARAAFNATLARVWHEPVSEDAPAPTDPTDEMPVHEQDSPLMLAVKAATDPLYAAMEKMSLVAEIIGRATQEMNRVYASPIYETMTLSSSNYPYVVKTHHRNHFAVFLAASQTIAVLIPGVGSVTFNLAQGWNQLDFPPGAEMTGTTAAAFSGLVCYSMDRVANA